MLCCAVMEVGGLEDETRDLEMVEGPGRDSCETRGILMLSCKWISPKEDQWDIGLLNRASTSKRRLSRPSWGVIYDYIKKSLRSFIDIRFLGCSLFSSTSLASSTSLLVQILYLQAFKSRIGRCFQDSATAILNMTSNYQFPSSISA